MNIIPIVAELDGTEIPCISNMPTKQNHGIFMISNPTTILEMTMGVQRKQRQEPHRLVCIQLLCPYPGCDKKGESICLECIDMYFGLRCCPEHQKNAQADCAFWMKTHGRCQMSKSFMMKNGLKDRTFTVKRSNGDLEDDWVILADSINFNRGDLVKLRNGMWGLVMNRPGHDITKTVPIQELNLESLLMPLIESLPDDEYVI